MATNDFQSAAGEWNTAGNWSLGHVPTSSEDTTFTGLDGSGALTITTTSANCLDIDFSTAGAAFTLSSSVNIACRSFTAKPGMSCNATGILRAGYNGSGTLTSNGVSLSSFSYITCGQGGKTITLGDALTTSILVVYGGNLTTNNNTISCTYFGDNATAGAVTLTLGSSTINCTNVSFAAATLTVTANTAAINITSTADITAHFGGQTWGGTVTVLMTGGKVFTLNGANTFNKFAISWTSANMISSIFFGANQIFSNVTSDALKITGSATIRHPIIGSSVTGTQRTLTAETTNITGTLDFRDINSANALDLSGINSGDCGGNQGITFRSPANFYVTTLTANRNYSGDIWSVADDGTADGTGVFPLPQDTAIINNNSGDNTNKILTLDLDRFCNFDSSALTESLTILLSAGTYYGDMVLTGNIAVTHTSGNVDFDARALSTLSINILPSIGAGSFRVYSYGGTVRLLTNGLTHTGNFTLTRGEFDRAGQTLSTNIFSSSDTNVRELSNTGGGGSIITKAVTGTVFDMGTVTNLTVSDTNDIQIGTGADTLTGNVTFAGGGKAFGDITVKKHAGDFDCLVTGDNSFADIVLETPDATYQYSDAQFPTATSTTCTSFTADGTADYKISFSGDLDDSSGTNLVNNCIISNSDASGGATWQALTSTDGGGNTGWVFLGLPVFDYYFNHMRNQ